LKKSNQKTFFDPGAVLVMPLKPRGIKSFLVLFFKKEPLFSEHPTRLVPMNQSGRKMR
jgi:hypothetical protein